MARDIPKPSIDPLHPPERHHAPPPPAPRATSASGKYTVKVDHEPELIVEAAGPEEAVEAYKKALGIISSPFEFVVAPHEEKTEAGRKPEERKHGPTVP